MTRLCHGVGFHVPPDSLLDGVYWVSSHHGPRLFEGGFTIRHGCVVRCAPVLADRLYYWFSKAVRISS